jgi:hypothetical protein
VFCGDFLAVSDEIKAITLNQKDDTVHMVQLKAEGVVIGFFTCPNRFSLTIALGSSQPLTEMSRSKVVESIIRIIKSRMR